MKHLSQYEIINQADKQFYLQQHIGEIEPVVRLLLEYQRSGKHLDGFIEIGTDKGGTFFVLSSLISGGKISIDFCDGGFGSADKKSFTAERNEKLAKKFTGTHFIEGDSHKYSTVLELKKILGSNKVSVLFIDGDHTFEGCYNDFLIYRQFVKQDGLILFHDIKNTQYHTSVNCRVDLAWDKIKDCLWTSDYYEFVGGDSTDCSTAMKHAVDLGWGGIGVVKNEMFFRRKNTHLFQVFYNQQSLDSCLNPLCDLPLKYAPVLMIHPENDHLYENKVVEDIYLDYKFDSKDFIGITSPIVTEKTGFPMDYIFELAMGNHKDDAIIYSPTYDELGLKDVDIWEANKIKRCNLYEGAEFLNNSKVLPYDLFTKKWYQCYCNYWIARNDIFRRYVSEVLIPVLDFFRYRQEFRDYTANIKFGIIHKEKPYPIEVFILEGLFGSFISNNSFKVKTSTKSDYEELLKQVKQKESMGVNGTKGIAIQKQYKKPYKIS